MGYTSHTWIRIFPVDDFPQTLLDDTLSILLAQTDPRSHEHNTPLHTKIHKRYIDIQIGFNRLPRMENLWTYLGSRDYDFEQAEKLMECKLVHQFEEWETYNLVTEIWYRFGHGDEYIDYIGCFSISDKWKLDMLPKKSCRYTFDKLIVKWETLPQSIQSDIFDWIKKDMEWELSFKEDYVAYNSRYSKIFPPLSGRNQQICIETPTTDIVGLETWDGWFYRFSKKYLEIADIFVQYASSIECYYQNRLVKLIKFNIDSHGKRQFNEYCLDYWDNCANSEWLAYKQEIGLEK